MANVPVSVAGVDFEVSIDMEILAESARKAALYAFHNLRERVRRRPKLEFCSSELSGSKYTALRTQSLEIHAENNQGKTLAFDFRDTLEELLASVGESATLRSYRVKIELWVTADSPAEAVQYAVDDLADDELPSWRLDVSLSTAKGSIGAQKIFLNQGHDF
jgi:hypothetical protein